jgi:hypothetical protein
MRNSTAVWVAIISICLAGSSGAYSREILPNVCNPGEAAQTQGNPNGHWEGIVALSGREIGLSLDLAKNLKAEWIASMGLPSENITGLVVMNVAVNDMSITFVAVELQMARFDLTLGSDGTMKGTVSMAQMRAPIEFRRTGEAKVELIPASPAVSKELEGDWEGELPMPNQTPRITVHFKNQPDRTVAATFEISTTGAIALPLNDVKQTGQRVEFGIRIAHASFQGTLNQEGTELTGQFSHEANSAPLTLRKK